MKLFGINVHLPRFNRSLSRNTGHGTRNTEHATRSFGPTCLADIAPDGPFGPVLGNAYEQVVWVYRAINSIADQVANIPFVFSSGERGRESLITSGPLLDFYARPHPHISQFQYWELRILWLLLRGECFRIPIFEHSPNLGRNLNRPLDPSGSSFVIRHSSFVIRVPS